MKLIEKPIIKLSPGMHEMREKIEWVRCITGHTVAGLAVKIGNSKDRIKDIIKGEKNPSFGLVEDFLTVFPMVKREWLLADVGQSGITEKNIQEYIFRKESKDTVNQEMCARVRHVREESGLSQAIFASHLRSSRDIIKWVESGKGNPTAILLARIADKFGIEDKWLLRGLGPIRVVKVTASKSRVLV